MNFVPILQAIDKYRPMKVLDIGCGLGKYGVLIRELEYQWYGIYRKCDRKVKLHALEPYAHYLGPLHNHIYDDLWIETLQEHIGSMKKYDLIMMIDVLEHFDKNEALIMLEECRKKGNVLVCIPIDPSKQGAVHGNELERHRCKFTKEEIEQLNPTIFVELPRFYLFTLDKDGKPLKRN